MRIESINSENLFGEQGQTAATDGDSSAFEKMLEEYNSAYVAGKDADGDGVLSAQELGVGAEVFDAIDSDDDGYASTAEMLAALKERMESGEAGLEEQALSLVADADADGDSALSYQEMEESAGVDAEAYSAMDSDGVASATELMFALQMRMQSDETAQEGRTAQHASAAQGTA